MSVSSRSRFYDGCKSSSRFELRPAEISLYLRSVAYCVPATSGTKVDSDISGKPAAASQNVISRSGIIHEQQPDDGFKLKALRVISWYVSSK